MPKMTLRTILCQFLQRPTYRISSTQIHTCRIMVAYCDTKPFRTYQCLHTLFPRLVPVYSKQHHLRSCSDSSEYKSPGLPLEINKDGLDKFHGRNDASLNTNCFHNDREVNRNKSKQTHRLSVSPQKGFIRKNVDLDQDDVSLEFSEDGKSRSQHLTSPESVSEGRIDGPEPLVGECSEYPGDEYFVISEECSKILTDEHRRNLELLNKEMKESFSMGLTPRYLFPQKMTDKMWYEVAVCSSRSARKKIMAFFFKREVKRRNRKSKKMLKNLKKMETASMEMDKKEVFKELYCVVKPEGMKLAAMQRQFNAWQEQTSFIVDMQYCDSLSHRERKHTSIQVDKLIHLNNKDLEPFHLLFCNFKGSSNPHDLVKDVLEKTWGLYTTESVNYTDMYPREKLVYLSPHSTNVLEEYDPDKIYIMGGIVDLHSMKPMTIKSAQRDNIETACLPLQKYLGVNEGYKVLTLNQVLRIMLDLKRGHDWSTALQHVPIRKTKEYQQKLELKRQEKKLLIDC